MNADSTSPEEIKLNNVVTHLTHQCLKEESHNEVTITYDKECDKLPIGRHYLNEVLHMDSSEMSPTLKHSLRTNKTYIVTGKLTMKNEDNSLDKSDDREKSLSIPKMCHSSTINKTDKCENMTSFNDDQVNINKQITINNNYNDKENNKIKISNSMNMSDKNQSNITYDNNDINTYKVSPELLNKVLISVNNYSNQHVDVEPFIELNSTTQFNPYKIDISNIGRNNINPNRNHSYVKTSMNENKSPVNKLKNPSNSIIPSIPIIKHRPIEPLCRTIPRCITEYTDIHIYSFDPTDSNSDDISFKKKKIKTNIKKPIKHLNTKQSTKVKKVDRSTFKYFKPAKCIVTNKITNISFDDESTEYKNEDISNMDEINNSKKARYTKKVIYYKL